MKTSSVVKSGSRTSIKYVLMGTGLAPLLAAQRLSLRGDSIALMNPDPDFFQENSELPLDLLHFQTTSGDLSKRFQNNLGDAVYRDLIAEFPGAVEMWKEENEQDSQGQYRVRGAPWIRLRHRLWMAPEGSKRAGHIENLYLRALDLGWKPQWLEGFSLARRFPGVDLSRFENRIIDRWIGFLGPRFADIDVDRYRIGMLQIIRERLGVENILMTANMLELDSGGLRYQLASGLPSTLSVSDRVLIFWTPRMERFLIGLIEKHQPALLAQLKNSTELQRWEEWEILSREPIHPYVVAHMRGIRIWAHGEGMPPVGGWNMLKVMRREELGESVLGAETFEEIRKMIFQYMGWQYFTVRKVVPRVFYRWNETAPIDLTVNGVSVRIIRACDGPVHWIANQVRNAIDAGSEGGG